jgi:hypothetical protein
VIVAELECVYDEEKTKPGFRVGVIENLTERLSQYPVATTYLRLVFLDLVQAVHIDIFY